MEKEKEILLMTVTTHYRLLYSALSPKQSRVCYAPIARFRISFNATFKTRSRCDEIILPSPLATILHSKYCTLAGAISSTLCFNRVVQNVPLLNFLKRQGEA